MNKLKTTLALAALTASLGTGVLAQQPTPATGAPQASGMRAEARHGDPALREQHRAQRQAQRMAMFRQQLQITPQQEGAWNAWMQAMQPAQVQRPNRVEFARMTTPERIDRMRTVRSQRMAMLDRRGEATKAFYATLSADQKRTFDEQGLRFARGGMRDGKGPRGHHGGYGGYGR